MSLHTPCSLLRGVGRRRTRRPLVAALMLGTLLGAACAGSPLLAAPAATKNHLAGQSSPYLLEHAGNPVDWYPWGDEALGRARREDRPIFLSIGYSSCHWCHVMERESFSDQEIAGLLNEGFIAIKVDREERPDLDALYMNAVLITTGGGGWPMSVFLTPDGKPFFGGTYYPRARFRDLLVKIHEGWQTHRKDLTDTANSVVEAMAELQKASSPERAGGSDADLISAAVAAYAKEFDPVNGGFGKAPKFPPHGALSLLLRVNRERGEKAALDMTALTLTRMARGGVYDQVGGGFHRYATDAAWLTPHFEKMLCDNALLVPVYLMAWKQSGQEEFRRVAEETLAWVGRDMTDPAGGFYAALDADTEGREGAYYLWTPDGMRQALGDDAALLGEYYGVDASGKAGAGGAVLHVALDDLAFATSHGVAEPEWRKQLASGKSRLLAARQLRARPHRDDKVLTAWNGLMISAFAVAHRATGERSYLETARRSASFALTHLRDGRKQVLVSWRQGRPGGPGYLDDNAFLARGLLDLYGADPDKRWLNGAIEVMHDAARFADPAGGYYFSAPNPDLLARRITFNDEALPSGNAVMAENLARLSRESGDLGYLRTASGVVNRGLGAMIATPSACPYLIMARATVAVALTASGGPASAESAAVKLAGAVTPAAADKPAAPKAAPASERSKPAAEVPAPQAAPPAEGASISGVVVGRANRESVVESQLVLKSARVHPGAIATAEVRLGIRAGWHINSSKPTLDYLIPTRIALAESPGVGLDSAAYPDGQMVKLEFADDRLSVYEGEVTIGAGFRVSRDIAPGTVTAKARLTYQACSNKACLPPETVEFATPIQVEGAPVAESAPSGGSGSAGSLRVEGQDQLSLLLKTRGLLFVIGVVFLGGLALTLTPCVYPMIPVTIGFFGNQTAGRGWRRVILPALYVLGMALTYSVLGVAAGLSGGLFGATLQSPWIVGAMVILFVAMALWMFGVYELRLPGFMMQVGSGRTGALGALVMGLTLGLVAAPCIGPFIVTLLAFVGASRSPALGFLLFFVLALGMGLPFLILGTFSGMLSSLPRSGVWLIYAKKVMGVGLLGVALYFLQPFLSDRVLGTSAIVFAAGAGLYLAVLEKTRVNAGWWKPLRLATGLLVILIGLSLAVPLVRARQEAAWTAYSAETFAAARSAGRPVVIDFFAVWCAPCRELDRHTFSDPGVMQELERFTLLKADLTKEDSERVQDLRRQYDVVGVPTIVVIDGQGNEKTDLRLTGFEAPEAFVARLRQVR